MKHDRGTIRQICMDGVAFLLFKPIKVTKSSGVIDNDDDGWYIDIHFAKTLLGLARLV